jgi:hypothetical protein
MKLYESLFILNKSNTAIQRLWRMINQNQERIIEIENDAVIWSFYIIMEAVSYTKEFEGRFFHNSEPQFKDRIMDVRKITAPVFRKIRKWKHLEDFRNHIIAHPWRDNDGKFTTPNINKYDVPRNWFEIGILAALVNYSYDLIEKEFATEAVNAFTYVNKLNEPPPPKKDISDLNQELYDMAKEVGSICKQLNKPYLLKVFLYEMEGYTFKPVVP